MKERIVSLRKAMGLTQKQFGERIGVQRGTVANYELGRNIPTEAVRKMICREYGVSKEWLEEGEGEMFSKEGRHEQVAAIARKHMNGELDLFRSRLIAAIAGLSEDQLAVLADIAEKAAARQERPGSGGEG